MLMVNNSNPDYELTTWFTVKNRCRNTPFYCRNCTPSSLLIDSTFVMLTLNNNAHGNQNLCKPTR
jgi:hypothetical protein